MKYQIRVKRITLDTVFRIVTIGMVFSFVPFSILMAILSFFGLGTITWVNDKPLTGIPALIASPFVGLLLALTFTVFLGIFMSFGLWLFSKFSSILIRYIGSFSSF